MRVCLIALILSLAPHAALGAPPPDPPPRPPLPVTPASLEPRVAKVTRLLRQVLERCSDGVRNASAWDRRCEGWLASIEAAGEAADHAIWRGFFPAGGQVSLFREVGNPRTWTATERIFAGLMARANPQAVTALVATIPEVTGWEHGELDPRERFRVLSGLTGQDPLPYHLTGGVDRALGCVGDAWRRFWAANHARPLEVLRLEGLEAARVTLESAGGPVRRPVMDLEACLPSEIDTRYHAAVQLLRSPEDRARVLAALRSELASPEAASEDISALVELAGKAGLGSEEREAALDARREALVARGDPEATAEQRDRDARALCARAFEAQPWREARATCTHPWGLHEGLGAACRREREALRLPEALAACEAFEALEEAGAAAHLALGWVHLELGQVAEAQARLEAAWEDDVLDDAFTLEVAILTVRGELARARALIARMRPPLTPELRARADLLAGRPAPAEWVLAVAPHHACWARKGEAAARAFLLRRGFVRPGAFTRGLAQLTAEARASVDAWVGTRCPWGSTP